MIPAAYILEWRNLVPWQETDMIELDLVLCRALVEVFNDSVKPSPMKVSLFLLDFIIFEL